MAVVARRKYQYKYLIIKNISSSGGMRAYFDAKPSFEIISGNGRVWEARLRPACHILRNQQASRNAKCRLPGIGKM